MIVVDAAGVFGCWNWGNIARSSALASVVAASDSVIIMLFHTLGLFRILYQVPLGNFGC